MTRNKRLDMTESPIFIVGCPRSGKTLLRNLLRSHPNIAISPESHFIPNFYKAFGNPSNEREAYQLAKRILSLHWVRKWGLSVEPSMFVHDRTFARVVSRIYQTFAQSRGKRRWGDETPSYIYELPLLFELFPHCKVLHVIRDARDVALDWLKHRTGPKNLFIAAHGWVQSVSKGCDTGATLGSETYLEVRYEELLINTVNTLRPICEFLNEPYHEALLQPTREPAISAVPMRPHRAEDDKIIRDNHLKWKNQMTRRQRILVDSIAGELLSKLSYETEGKTRHISIVEKAFWHSHHLLEMVLYTLRRGEKSRWILSHIKIRWAWISSQFKSTY